MDELKFHKTIVKFLNREATHNELEQLDLWLKDDKNIPAFNLFVRAECIAAQSLAECNLEKVKKSVHQKIKEAERKRRAVFYRRISVAASILLIFGITFFKFNKKQDIDVTETSAKIEVGSNKAILTLENGEQVTLGKGDNYNTDNLISNGDAIVYKNGTREKGIDKKTSFNYLTIPKGGQFQVELSDGTKAWLNSDTQLKYPTHFQEGRPREIELVYGEVYLEVSPSSEHNGSVFNINTEEQEVSVLGTKFNIKAYTNDTKTITTLVEGKVMVKKGSSQEILRPNQQSRIESSSDKIDVAEVDVSREISWVNGLFDFSDETLGEMMKVLSRWYDVEIIFESDEHKDFVFTGVLERAKSFVDIIEIIESASEGEVEFEIIGKTVIVK